MLLTYRAFSIVLVIASLVLSIPAFGKEDKNDRRVKVITPDLEIKKAKPVALDDERFEVGSFFGGIGIEDYSIKPLVGSSLVFHFDDRLFAQILYGASDAERATFEDVLDGNFLADEDEAYTYFALRAGINVFNSRSYLGKNLKFNSRIYFVAGLGQTYFAGQDSFTFHFGPSYRIVVTDWLTWNIDFINHIHERDLFGEEKVTQNIEISTGLNFMF